MQLLGAKEEEEEEREASRLDWTDKQDLFLSFSFRTERRKIFLLQKTTKKENERGLEHLMSSELKPSTKNQ
jgi:hypothetical protein